MSICDDFIQAARTVVRGNPKEYPPSLFTDAKNLTNGVCHKLVIKALKEAGAQLPGVDVSGEDTTYPDQGERKLHGGWNRTLFWRISGLVNPSYLPSMKASIRAMKGYCQGYLEVQTLAT